MVHNFAISRKNWTQISSGAISGKTGRKSGATPDSRNGAVKSTADSLSAFIWEQSDGYHTNYLDLKFKIWDLILIKDYLYLSENN